ncbi:MAG: zinc ribbon domain-containing protein [Hydrogenophaga sp.]|uniref:Zn-ribbon domain-containing OB-fold protein n=1 Tax=Hydrogenophaga sp. TaxID=1904254 RepID=UPI00263049CB|nr:zinc ribbon domain-containing protein [Hydrogenophaga sp.]MCV0438914.1 zinc ribbon domain-containing protein [Hydrogenophaga sp.]
MSILKPYFDGLIERRLLIPYCKSCGKPHFYPRHACPSCWGEEYDWKDASGNARIGTHTRVLANPPSAFEPLLPFEIAIVELEEGVSMLTNIVGGGTVSVDAKVSLEFIERNGQSLPVFRLTNGT